MKAIQTQYNGYRFRSRTEARWAVYFDAIGIKYEYEPEGYVLDSGEMYLPDFWLPQVGMFAEVKGSQGFTEAEVDKCAGLPAPCLCLIGPPEANADFGDGRIHGQTYGAVGRCATWPPRCDWETCEDSCWESWLLSNPITRADWDTAIATPEIRKAVAAARSARFEYGEMGPT